MGGVGQRERETQNPKQVPGSELSAHSLMWGSNSRTMRPRLETKSRVGCSTDEPLRCPKQGFLIVSSARLVDYSLSYG